MFRPKKRLLVLPAASVVALTVALGSGGCSSQPAFCSDVDSLRSSVNELVSIQVNSNTINEVQTDFLRTLRIVLDAGYRGYVGIEYEGTELSEPDGIRATKALLERVRETLAS